MILDYRLASSPLTLRRQLDRRLAAMTVALKVQARAGPDVRNLHEGTNALRSDSFVTDQVLLPAKPPTSAHQMMQR